MSGFGWNDYNPPLANTTGGAEPGNRRGSQKPSNGRRRFSFKTRMLLIAVLVAVATAAGVFAYFTSHGTATATASSGSLAAPTVTQATPGAGTVALAWSSVSAPGVDAVRYYVTRDGGDAAGNCATSGSPTTATSCTDTGLAAGTYTYTVTAVWHSWTNSSPSSSATLASGAATQIVLSGSNLDLVSGSTRTLTATVEDAQGSTVTSGADSSVSISFASTSGPGTVSGLGSSMASGGVAAKVVTGDLAGAITLQASGTLIAGATNSNTLSFNVVHSAATQVVLTGAVDDLGSGSNRTFTATIQDAAGNTVIDGPDSTDPVTFAKIGGSGTVTGLVTTPAVGGVANNTVTGALAGILMLQASATLSGPGVTGSNTLTFNVVAGAADHIDLTGSAADLSSGSTRLLTATIKDAAGNTVTTDNTTVISFAKTAGAGTLSGLGTATAASGIATKTVTGVLAGSITLAGSATGIPAGATLTFNIVAGAADHIDLTGSAADLSSGSTRLLTATIKDAAGNTVTTDNTTVISFAKTAGAGTLSGLGTATAASGIATKTVTGVLAGSITLAGSATGIPAGATLTFNIVAGAADHIDLTGSAADLSSGSTRLLTATIKDAAGNTVTTDNTTVISFAKTAGAGTLSGLGTATAASGIATKTVTGVLAGSITLAGSATGIPAGATLTFNIVAGAADHIDLTGSAADLSSGSTRLLTATIKDAAGNTVTTDNTTVISFAKTAGAGTLSGLGTATAASGIATKTVTGVLAGSITLAGSATGIPAGATLTFNIVAGTATKLAFTTSPQTIVAGGGASGTITVEREDPAGNATTLGGAISVGLTTTSGGGSFRNSADTSIITSVTIASGNSSADFKYKDTTAGSPTVTAASSPLTSATQSETVVAQGTQTALATGAWNNVDTWTATSLPGTVTTSSASATVTGSGTSFLTQVTPGDRILLSNGTTSIGVVLSVTDNTHLTLTTNAASTNTNIAYTHRSIPDSADNVTIGIALTVTIPSGYNAVANSVAVTNTNGNNTTTVLAVTSGTLTVTGDLSITEGAGQRHSSATVTTGTVTVGGNLSVTGTLDMSGGAGTFNLAGSMTGGGFTAGTTSTFNFNGTAAQSIPVNAFNFNNVTVNNTSATGATLAAAISAANVKGDVRVQSGTLDNGGNAIVGNAAKTFQVAANATFKLSGTTSTFPSGFGTFALDATSTVNYGGTGAQSVAAVAGGYGNLDVGGGNTKTAAAPGLTINGNFSIASATTFVAGALGHTIKGNFSNAGTFTANTSTVTFGGTSPQTISGPNATTFNNLTVANAVALTGVDTTVNATLALGTSILSTGSNKVVVSTTGGTPVTRSTGFVDGKLQKAFAAGASTVVFDVGAGATYAPISVTVAGANSGGTLIGSTTGAQHPNYATSGLSATQYVNRYWTLTAGTLTVTGYSATFTFVAGDLVGSPNTAALLVKRWTGSSRVVPASSSSTSVTVTGTTFGNTFGDYAAGN